jgi:hypothetical protein
MAESAVVVHSEIVRMVLHGIGGEFTVERRCHGTVGRRRCTRIEGEVADWRDKCIIIGYERSERGTARGARRWR